MLKDRILVHLVAELSYLMRLWVELENDEVDFLEAAERVDGSAIAFRSLEEVFCTRVHPLVRIFAWAASATATCRRVPQLSIGAFRVLLLHVSVKSWVGQVGFLAILALKVAALVVVLGAALA